MIRNYVEIGCSTGNPNETFVLLQLSF